jgi:hypothetical protein
MCCVFTSLALLGPRFAILIWWLFDPGRWDRAFDTWIWPVLGFFFVPWMTLMYVLVRPGGLIGFDWVWLGLALACDILTFTGGGYGNRDRVPYYSTSQPY